MPISAWCHEWGEFEFGFQRASGTAAPIPVPYAGNLTGWGNDIINGTNGIRSTSQTASVFTQ